MNKSDSRLLYVLRLLFTHLANLLIKNRIRIGPVIEELKIAYVTAARRHHGSKGKPASINRVSALTGMSRKHVSTLLSKAEGQAGLEFEVYSGAADIMSAWLAHSEYLDEFGKPLSLEPGPGPGSLQALADAAVGTERSEEALEQLFGSGSVRQCADGRYELLNRRYSVSKDLVSLLGGGPVALLSTIDKNWDKPIGTGFAQRYVHVHKLEPDKLLDVRRVSRERVAQFLEGIDDYFSGHEIPDGGPFDAPEGHEISTVGVGAYYFETEYR